MIRGQLSVDIAAMEPGNAHYRGRERARDKRIYMPLWQEGLHHPVSVVGSSSTGSTMPSKAMFSGRGLSYR